MIDGTVRRLPSWMTAEATKTASVNSLNENNKKKKRSHDSVSTDSKQTTSDQNSFSLKKCVTKRRKLQVIETHSKKRKNGNSPKRNAKGDESLSFSDDEEDDFTVEDLVSIAEEYVKNEDGRAEKRLLKTENRSKKRISETGSCVSEVEGAVIAGGGEQVESRDKIIVEGTEQCSVQGNRTGDPARDMLDLLLGPLLNKPMVEDDKINCVESDTDFSIQLVKENRHDIPEEMVVPSKKKSSLKNKHIELRQANILGKPPYTLNMDGYSLAEAAEFVLPNCRKESLKGSFLLPMPILNALISASKLLTPVNGFIVSDTLCSRLFQKKRAKEVEDQSCEDQSLKLKTNH